MPPSACVVVHPAERYTGAQGASYLTGLTSESVGTTGICMTVLLLPVGARSRTHLHRSIESAAYVLEGELETRSGERLEHTIMARSGHLVYIPADLPHMV
ncbi:MAG: cupin domain-containing protein, partial [Gaiellaceae bacterium]